MLLEFQAFQGFEGRGVWGGRVRDSGFHFPHRRRRFLRQLAVAHNMSSPTGLAAHGTPTWTGSSCRPSRLVVFGFFFRVSATGAAVAEAICRAFCDSNANHKF